MGGFVVAVPACALGGAGATVLPAPASAQTAMEQPRPGQLLRGGPAHASRHNAWSLPGTALPFGAGWQQIKLLDIDSDGHADLWGVYGPLAGGNFVYGCELHQVEVQQLALLFNAPVPRLRFWMNTQGGGAIRRGPGGTTGSDGRCFYYNDPSAGATEHRPLRCRRWPRGRLTSRESAANRVRANASR